MALMMMIEINVGFRIIFYKSEVYQCLTNTAIEIWVKFFSTTLMQAHEGNLTKTVVIILL